ncbi:MAG: putative transport system permease protein [Sphingomonadales bacterium]|jgi:putative ABC transport system permease protein|nr:putative transport system permease protein [Sphingomonadales bacterium]
MWLHYFKMCFRAMARQRFLSAINLVGLAAGLASVILIFLHVTAEFSYDGWVPQHERIYRIDTVETTPGQKPIEMALAPGPVAAALAKDFPQIEEVTRAYVAPLTVSRDGQPFSEDILVADPNLFSVLELPFRAGAGDGALRAPASVVLSERAAMKYFGVADPIGRRLAILTPEPRDYVVSAVFRTIPHNSHLKFDIVIPHAGYFPLADEDTRGIPDNWGGAYFHTYARLKPGADSAAIERDLPAFVDRSLPQWLTGLLKTAPHDFYKFRFVPLRNVHFDGASMGAMKPPASRTTMLALSVVALLILLIAAINFANLSAARSTLRAREVALRKVVGAGRRQILAQFLLEAVTLTALAAVLGLAVAELALPWLGDLLGLERGAAVSNYWKLWALLAAAIVVTALGSGLYPSVVAARIRPAAVFNRGATHLAGGGMRSALVVIQFAISIALITTTVVIAMQTRFARDVDLGFDRRNMLIVRAPEGADGAALAAAFRDEVARRPDVVGVALSSAVPSDLSEDNISISRPGSVKPIQLGYHKVNSDFFRTYGVRPLSGRTDSMRQAGEASTGQRGGAEATSSALINAAALNLLGFKRPSDALGEVVRAGEKAFTIVGVVPDLHFRSLHEPVREELYALDATPGTAVSIRYRTSNLEGFLAAIDGIWSRRVPGHAVQREFLDEALEALYAREHVQAALLGLFSAVAIVISCLGLIAMAAFTVQRRTKEIAIRKVLGARSRDIFQLLLWQFLKPVVAANLLAWPVAFLIARRWLDQFAYRIDLPISAFVVASLAAALIACGAVAAHSFRVARSNPATALKYE